MDIMSPDRQRRLNMTKYIKDTDDDNEKLNTDEANTDEMQKEARIELEDNEQFFTLEFKIHPSQSHHKEKLMAGLDEAIAKSGAWLNPIILTISENEYRLDIIVRNRKLTRKAIAKLLKKYVIKKFEFTLDEDD